MPPFYFSTFAKVSVSVSKKFGLKKVSVSVSNEISGHVIQCRLGKPFPTNSVSSKQYLCTCTRARTHGFELIRSNWGAEWVRGGRSCWASPMWGIDEPGCPPRREARRWSIQRSAGSESPLNLLLMNHWSPGPRCLRVGVLVISTHRLISLLIFLWKSPLNNWQVKV